MNLGRIENKGRKSDDNCLPMSAGGGESQDLRFFCRLMGGMEATRWRGLVNTDAGYRALKLTRAMFRGRTSTFP
jgi:hypothetical protein